jgi:glutathione reductase (NADPH)
MVDTPKEYDYICIGAGSGSMGSGRRAAMFNKRVLMIENKAIGGTCVNVGCVPKKVMLNLTSFLEDREVMKDYGIKGLENTKLDFQQFKAARDAYVKRLNGIYANNLKNSKIDFLEGTASFESDHVVAVNGLQYTAPHILIASGSYPTLKGAF